MRALISALLALGAVTCGACGADPLRPRTFSSEWTGDGGASFEALQARRRGTIPAGASVVVGVAGNADRILGLVLDTGARWSVAHAVDTRPVVAGGVVVASGGGALIAIDAMSGKRLWSRPVGKVTLFGAGDDGVTTAVSLSSGAAEGGTLLVIARDGSVRRQIETDKPIGVPAVAYDRIFVPWSDQYVSAIDVTSGEEVGRVVLREKTSRAFTKNGALYFGETGFTRFDERIRDAPRNGASYVGLPPHRLAGAPRLMASGRERLAPAAGPFDRTRLYARPAAGPGPLVLDGGRFYATSAAIVLGLDARTGETAWEYVHDAAIIGGDAAPSGLVVCDERGRVILLGGERGTVSRRLDLGGPIRACIVSVDALAVALPGGA